MSWELYTFFEINSKSGYNKYISILSNLPYSSPFWDYVELLKQKTSSSRRPFITLLETSKNHPYLLFLILWPVVNAPIEKLFYPMEDS